MTLLEKQMLFSRMFARLLLYAESLGYQITMGEGYAYPDDHRHIEGSCHYQRLAHDINLFKSGVYLTETEDHRVLGEYWEAMGGSWGGRFSDGNHYSLEHNGMR